MGSFAGLSRLRFPYLSTVHLCNRLAGRRTGLSSGCRSCPLIQSGSLMAAWLSPCWSGYYSTLARRILAWPAVG